MRLRERARLLCPPLPSFVWSADWTDASLVIWDSHGRNRSEQRESDERPTAHCPTWARRVFGHTILRPSLWPPWVPRVMTQLALTSSRFLALLLTGLYSGVLTANSLELTSPIPTP